MSFVKRRHGPRPGELAVDVPEGWLHGHELAIISQSKYWANQLTQAGPIDPAWGSVSRQIMAMFVHVADSLGRHGGEAGLAGEERETVRQLALGALAMSLLMRRIRTSLATSANTEVVDGETTRHVNFLIDLGWRDGHPKNVVHMESDLADGIFADDEEDGIVPDTNDEPVANPDPHVTWYQSSSGNLQIKREEIAAPTDGLRGLLITNDQDALLLVPEGPIAVDFSSMVTITPYVPSKPS